MLALGAVVIVVTTTVVIVVAVGMGVSGAVWLYWYENGRFVTVSRVVCFSVVVAGSMVVAMTSTGALRAVVFL